MPAGAISNDTASQQSSKALDRILTNINSIAEIKPGFKAFVGPSEKALSALHQAPEDKDVIKTAFQEMGEQAASFLEKLKGKTGFNKFWKTMAALSDKVLLFFKRTKAKTKNEISVSEKTITDLVKFSEQSNGAILKAEEKGGLWVETCLSVLAQMLAFFRVLCKF